MKQKNFLKYFLIFVAFAVIFTAFFLLKKVGLEKEFLAAAMKVPSIRNFNSGGPMQAMKIINTYGALAGVALGLVSFLASLILLGILKAIRLSKFSLAHMLVLFLVYGAYLALGIELIHYEVRYTVMAIAVIFFVGFPLYYASVTTLVLIFLVYLFSMFRKKSVSVEEDKKPSAVPGSTMAAILLCLALPFVLSGCSIISWLEGNVCDVTTDPHCFQGEAVDAGDADECAKVTQPADFKSVGSNPPKDKCYMMVAENTGDLEACNKIKGGMYSYTREECLLEASVANENPSGCQMLTGSDRQKCIETLGPKITPEKVLDVDSQIELINNELKKGSDPNLEKQLKGLENKKKDMLAVMTADNKKEYSIQSDPLNRDIIGDWAVGTIDSATKNKLIDLNEKLKAAGSGLTSDQYSAVRDYYKFVNDPANDIEKMDDAALAKDRLGDKFKNVVNKLKFWKVNDTSEEKALDEQIRFYERMTERQAGIDKGLSEKETAYENTLDKIKEKVVEKGADMAKEKLIEHIFGETTGLTTKVTTAVLGEAINEVKEEAKSAEFRGLVNAYDKGMEEELGHFGGNVDKASAEVAKKLTADPYAYATGDSFAKYGNLIENKDCDGSNPHCLNKDVFWKSMKKSYKYQHQN